MSVRLPSTLLVIERGWLSANNIVAFDGNQATVIDSGYVSESERTVVLVRAALAGRNLTRLLNTHAHSDHMGGNAALQAAFGCDIFVPTGMAQHIEPWDEAALLLSPLGQQAGVFRHDAVVGAGETLHFGEMDWQALSVPGHDMDALAYYNPERRILISGDALWENGFGVIFPALLGTADGLASCRDTLEMLGRLPIDIVIPGHGSPFTAVESALERAFGRLARYAANADSLAWHAIKVIVSFALMAKGRLDIADFGAFLRYQPVTLEIAQGFLGLDETALADKLLKELPNGKTICRDGDTLFISNH